MTLGSPEPETGQEIKKKTSSFLSTNYLTVHIQLLKYRVSKRKKKLTTTKKKTNKLVALFGLIVYLTKN